MAGVRATILAGQLLREAAAFFDSVAQQNPELAQMMCDNAEVYREVAGAVESDPTAALQAEGMDPAPTTTELAIRLLMDASEFFDNVASQNPEQADDLPDTAEAFRMLADLLTADPAAELPTDA